MRALRFDLQSTRSALLQTDKFAFILEIWNRLANNISGYERGENLGATDEQLFPTKCSCRFTQYMLNKPDKFSITFWLAVDLKSNQAYFKFHSTSRHVEC